MGTSEARPLRNLTSSINTASPLANQDARSHLPRTTGAAEQFQTPVWGSSTPRLRAKFARALREHRRRVPSQSRGPSSKLRKLPGLRPAERVNPHCPHPCEPRHQGSRRQYPGSVSQVPRRLSASSVSVWRRGLVRSCGRVGVISCGGGRRMGCLPGALCGSRGERRSKDVSRD